MLLCFHIFFFFFFNDTATTEIYTLSLHDALPICSGKLTLERKQVVQIAIVFLCPDEITCASVYQSSLRSEEHTSELQSQSNLVCRLLLEKKKKLIHFTIADLSHKQLSFIIHAPPH